MSRSATLLGLVALLLALAAPPAAAQSQTVTGVVTDATSGDPLPFVNIIIQGTTRGVATDVDGNYSIEVPGPDAVLLYRFLGYVEQAITVGSQSVINVGLEEDSNVLDDIVVVGYGTQRRGDVTASVATVDIDDANQAVATAPTDLIEGRVAGVNVVETSGEPGAGVSIRIRGGTSIAASNEPLYVVDGIPISGANVTPGGSGEVGTSPPRNPLTLLNPNDIESITILKDASATAIYGSRGANGVVLITTKSGVAGQVTIDYEGTTSFATAAQTFDVLSADQFRGFVQNAVADRVIGYDDRGNLIDIVGGSTPVPAPTRENPDRVVFPNGTADVIDNLGGANTDFNDAVFRTAVSQSHNLSFGGGSAGSQYRASLSYLNQEGVVISSGLERITGRLNAETQFLDDRLRFGLNLTSALTNDDFTPANATGGFRGGIFQNVIDFRPDLPVTVADGADGAAPQYTEIAGQRDIRNPVGLAEQLDETGRTTRTLGNVTAALDLVEGLTAQLNLGGDRSVGTRRAFYPNASPVGAEFGGAAFQQTLNQTSVTLQTYLTYTRAFGQNNLDLLGGYEYSDFDRDENAVQGVGFTTDFTEDNDIRAAEDLPVVGGNYGPGNFSTRSENLLASFFTRANYNFDQKYYLTGSLRYDGSSRFSEDNRYALFPAVSGAWRISEESFLAGNSTVSDLRLRAGYGVVGNQDIGDYLYLPLLGYSASNSAVIDGEVLRGYAPFQLVNPDLQWEQKEEFTVGLDYRVLGDRVFGSIEFFRNTTNDLLLPVTIPQPAAVSTQIQNIGSLRNTGVDISLDAFLLETERNSVSLGVTFSTVQNEILELGGRDQLFTGRVSGRGQSDINALLLTPGEEFPVIYGPEFTGRFVPEGTLDDDGNDIGGLPLFNDYEAEDLDGDGLIGPLERTLVGETRSPGSDDRVKIGSARPDFTYGIRLNGEFGDFAVRAFFRGEQGRDLFNNTALVYETQSAGLQGRNFIAGDFSPDESRRAAPIFSSRYVEDASFFRLDQLTLEYGVGRFIPQLRSARLFLTGNNLFVITPYSGLDPEVNTNAAVGQINAIGIDYLNYPRARTFSIGVNLGL
ncbi:TonB-dependent receptor [Rubrivirga sp. S365]|uniref:SusC/RagA family TonB-linked outer membrane protein n=1 Tax=Rubrivirga sp. S365 TaxID=3076080 RepID=UPI0028C640C3|nr:TonB-dependent receptor [Rubrivirga sp. S365]MDT7855778.1 TonB-dependent receptor [Rubrivirga sp. S365]